MGEDNKKEQNKEKVVDEEITTSVDKLLEILKNHDKLSMNEAAKKLGVGMNVVQSWVDFLVEEHIVGIEYKFTKPFIYLNKPGLKIKKTLKEEPKSFGELKQEFIVKARSKSIPEKDLEGLWENHLKQILERKKDFFFAESEKRGLKNKEKLWKEYQEKLLSM